MIKKQNFSIEPVNSRNYPWDEERKQRIPKHALRVLARKLKKIRVCAPNAPLLPKSTGKCEWEREQTKIVKREKCVRAWVGSVLPYSLTHRLFSNENDPSVVCFCSVCVSARAKKLYDIYEYLWFTVFSEWTI